MLKERRSVRKYKDEIVPKEVMDKVMDSARYAPSWGNTQVARYTLVTDPDIIKALAERCVKKFVYNVKVLENAKNVAVLSYVQGKSGAFEADKAKAMGLGNGGYVTDKGSDWEIFDAGIACQTFCLAAHEQGVGTCVMGVIDSDNIAEAIALPNGETVAALIPYGYPAEEPKPTPRLSVEQITRYI
ncbi:MAG: nitroreductase [Epulopiscium sp. Nele67-Bin001]|nr:MAG: nitroreductase [Epulopiscium sp. Nuni2H_MBin001]OON92760.1 MAG: nitroreductase [Epulopiscium sp. Nele67-Bin001]